MKTKIVYVLVSGPGDLYLEQAFVSMHSLKRYSPDAHVTLVADLATEASFTGVRRKEIRYVDEMVAVDLPDATAPASRRSRQLKTSVRNRVEGDFLYIDCDTLVARPLDAIDGTEAELAACRDTHSRFADNPYREMDVELGHRLGWPVENEEEYFNSGVIYAKDTPLARDFYTRWNRNLTEGYARDVVMDQSSLAQTNWQMGHPVRLLPDAWNCEVKHGIRYFKDAYVLHYLCTNPSRLQDRQLFLLNEKEALLRVKETGEITPEIHEVVEDPFKGLAEATHCFAGRDLEFFQSWLYNYARWQYRKGPSSPVYRAIRLMGWLGRAKRRWFGGNGEA
jgi:hypothetical protein